MVENESVIIGVEIKVLLSHADDRGFFREVIRSTDKLFSGPFGQWSHSKMTKNTVKAWHYHHRQTDWWYIALGEVEVVLYDNRSQSPTKGKKMVFKAGNGEDCILSVIKIPPGVLHACKVLSKQAHLFYITSHTYDPKDEGRFPFNKGPVRHDWGNPEELIVAERDKKYHIPPYDLDDQNDGKQ